MIKRSMKAVFAAATLVSGVQALAQSDNAAPEARREMAAFADCVAAASPDKTAQTLAMDFTERSYRSALRTLADTNTSCLKARGTTMRASGLPFAGALAEAMLRRQTTPLKSVLARGAAVAAPPAYSTTDAAALCAVRSTPDDVAVLVASAVASSVEQELLARIRPVYTQCAGDQRIEATDTALRAMLATAAFRVARGVSAGGAAGSGS